LPVVFVHAFPLNRTMWDPQVGALVGECRCIPLDLRGLGESAAQPPYSMDRYADDVVAVLDTLQIERARDRGSLARRVRVVRVVAASSRSRSRRSCSADTRAGGDTVETVARRHELIELAETQGSAAVANAQIAGLVGKTTRDSDRHLRLVHRMMSQAPETGVVGSLEAMIRAARLDADLATMTSRR